MLPEAAVALANVSASLLEERADGRPTDGKVGERESSLLTTYWSESTLSS